MFKKRGTELTGFLADKKFLMATTTLVGTVVGAGILGIPYVIAKAGVIYGLLLLLALGFGFIIINLFAGEVVLRTKQQFQLTGYAQKYLGPWGKRLMLISMITIIYGALTAYLIGEGAALYSIFNVGSPLIFSLVFFVIASLIVVKGIKATGRSELFLIIALILVVALIGLFSLDKIQLQHFSSFNPIFFFLPYGVILFAYMGAPAIPQMREELGKNLKKMKLAIIIGTCIPIVLYLLFAVVVVGVVGLDNFELLGPNERIATIALSVYSNHILGFLANMLAILAMFTSYLTLGLAGIEMYHFDYKIPKGLSIALVFILPLLILLFDLTSFIAVLGVSGALAGGLEGPLLILSYWKAKKLGDRKPEYSLPNFYVLGSGLIGLFVLGILFQIVTRIF